MQKYKSNITSTSGAAVRNVPVHVLKEDGAPASLFLDRDGMVPAPNPLTTGADGTFYFYAVNGRYSLRTTVDGVTITDEDVVLMMDPQEITVAGPIAEAVAAAQAAAVAAEFAVEGSGIPELVAAAQNAVMDANAATAQSAAAATLAESAKTDATAAKTAAEAAVTSANAAANSAALSATDASNSALAAAQIETTIDPTFLRSRDNHTGMQPIGTVTGLQDALSSLSTAGGIANTPAGSIAATTVQAALNELDSEKVAKTDVIAIANGGTGATSANAAADAIGAYRKETILGTVSQSAGVPTGAVIERGSNANGQYVRFADGTQICFVNKVAASAPTTAFGAVFRTAPTLWAYPSIFVNSPVFSVVESSGTGFCWGALGDAPIDNTAVKFSLFSATSQPYTPSASLYAIGRWF